MLTLKELKKSYQAGDTKVEALKGITLHFRNHEFVSILGPSGCGKTTMLNVIGGLDQYDRGDLIVNGKSTKEYKDRDWDSYRNHSIGFIFQSYNLIPHQTVLANVELALTLSGVSKEERRRKAMDALTKVGLADQMNKKPNQMSGGQMQRVAIARALVNDPEILLADEPTGALDTETSIQVMEILKKISKDKLIIMVTHNPELAEKYSNRIVRVLDGKVIDDSNPYDGDKVEVKEKKDQEKQKTSMSAFTAFSLSFHNLLTKKGRTFMTAFAGSIGIIGIALILSISNGIQNYIDRVQEDTLSSYPITLEAETVDYSTMMNSMMGNKSEDEQHELDAVYSKNIFASMMESMAAELQTNNISLFKDYLDQQENIDDLITDIKYTYDLDLQIYSADTKDQVYQVNPSDLITRMYAGMGVNIDATTMAGMNTMGFGLNIWTEMLDNEELVQSQYDVLVGRWPEKYDEVAVFVDSNNEISDMVLYALGLRDEKEMDEIIKATMLSEEYEVETSKYEYDDILNTTFKLVLNTDYYTYDDEKEVWVDRRDDKDYMKQLVDDGMTIKIVGIMKPNEDATARSVSGTIGYTEELTYMIMDQVNNSDIVKAQMATPDIDIFTGVSFPGEDEEVVDEEVTMETVQMFLTTLPEEEQQAYMAYMETLTEDQMIALVSEMMPKTTTDATYDNNLKLLGVTDITLPKTINIYAKDFHAKETLTDMIETYNKEQTKEGKEENVIHYTDYVGLIMSSVSTIINAISYVLIAFVAISLVVSSIMIGIITYISVLERTKEIGILRAIGASKKDISRVFNAETLIVGLTAGAIGIIVTLLLNIPINIIIENLTSIKHVAALPPVGAIILILISMFLTWIAGLIPSKYAAKKDPVVALRSE